MMYLIEVWEMEKKELTLSPGTDTGCDVQEKGVVSLTNTQTRTWTEAGWNTKQATESLSRV